MRCMFDVVRCMHLLAIELTIEFDEYTDKCEFVMLRSHMKGRFIKVLNCSDKQCF